MNGKWLLITLLASFSPLFNSQHFALAAVANIKVTTSEFSKNANVRRSAVVEPGTVIRVSLPDYADGGFSWSANARISNASVVKQISHRIIPPDNPALLGAPGTDIWRFRALHKGRSSIYMEDRRPWSGELAHTFRLFTRVVRPHQ